MPKQKSNTQQHITMYKIPYKITGMKRNRKLEPTMSSQYRNKMAQMIELVDR